MIDFLIIAGAISVSLVIIYITVVMIMFIDNKLR